MGGWLLLCSTTTKCAPTRLVAGLGDDILCGWVPGDARHIMAVVIKAHTALARLGVPNNTLVLNGPRNQGGSIC